MICDETIGQLLLAGERCVLVTITNVKGSAPRNAGTSMIVTVDGNLHGTIGGGALEWQAISTARQILDGQEKPKKRQAEFILGPDLRQCCGGVVTLEFELFRRERLADLRAKINDISSRNARIKLLLFGAGHVGQAVVSALTDLPFDIMWVDSRKNVFPGLVPANVTCKQESQSEQVLAEQHKDAFVVIMTHDHDMDFQIALSALGSDRFSFVGLIGSATKKARFISRFRQKNLSEKQISRLSCPVGIDGIRSKRPAAIATSIAARLLIERELVKTGKNTVRFQQKTA